MTPKLVICSVNVLYLALSFGTRGTSIARDRSRSVASRSRSDAEDSKFSDRTSSAEPHVTDMEQEEDENKDSTPRFNLLKNGKFFFFFSGTLQTFDQTLTTQNHHSNLN